MPIIIPNGDLLHTHSDPVSDNPHRARVLRLRDALPSQWQPLNETMDRVNKKKKNGAKLCRLVNVTQAEV